MIGIKDYVHQGEFKKDIPLLKKIIIIKKINHFINQKQTKKINQHLYNFFNKFQLIK